MEPVLGPFSWYIDSFFELNTCRSGLSLSPIPFTAIIEFVNIYGVEDFEDFFYIMRKLDSIYIEVSDRESKNGENSKTSNS